MALYIKNHGTGAYELTKLHPGDVLAFDLKSRTICIGRPPSGLIYFGDNGQPSDNKSILYEMAANRGSAFSVAKLLADAAGLRLIKSELTVEKDGIVAFELKA